MTLLYQIEVIYFKLKPHNWSMSIIALENDIAFIN